MEESARTSSGRNSPPVITAVAVVNTDTSSTIENVQDIERDKRDTAQRDEGCGLVVSGVGCSICCIIIKFSSKTTLGLTGNNNRSTHDV